MFTQQEKQQLTLNFEAGLSDSFPDLRDYINHRVHHQGKALKIIAADMDLSPSDLSRKLAQNPNDSRRLTVDDFEKFMEVTGDTSPIEYLAEKYLYNKAKDDYIRKLESELARAKGAA